MCFPLLSCIPRNVFVEHTVLQGCVNRAIAYILGILCMEGTNAVCGDGGFWCGSSNAIPYSLFLDFDHANPTVHVASESEACSGPRNRGRYVQEGL